MKTLMLLTFTLLSFAQEYNFTSVNNTTNVRCGVLLDPKYIGCEIRMTNIDEDGLDESRALALAWLQIKPEIEKRGFVGTLAQVGYGIGRQAQSDSSYFSSISKSGSAAGIERKTMIIVDIPKDANLDVLLKLIPETVKAIKLKKYAVSLGIPSLGIDDISVYRNEILNKIKADISEIESAIGSKGLIIKGLEDNPVLSVSGNKLKVILPVSIEITK